MKPEEITAVRDAAFSAESIASRFPPDHLASYILKDAANRLWEVARHFEQKNTPP